MDQYLAKKIKRWGSLAAKMEAKDMIEQFKKEYFTNPLILNGVTDRELFNAISKQLKALARSVDSRQAD